MEPLPLAYSKNSYNFVQVFREDDIAIYEQIEPENNRLIGYEVFRVKKQKESTMPNGLVIKAKETPPSASEWGQYGFTVYTLDQAMAKVEVLKSKKKSDG